MASAMTEVAVRLAEPDQLAEQSVASVGQTIRRQVAAMNDAISRAIGRASELEAMVHSEVAALERSYSENEIRVSGLISELATEREALSNNSARVSEALKGVGAGPREISSLELDRQEARRARDAAHRAVGRSLQRSGRAGAQGSGERAGGHTGPARTPGQRARAPRPGDRSATQNLTALEIAVVQRTTSLDKTMKERTEALQTTLATRIKGLETSSRKARSCSIRRSRIAPKPLPPRSATTPPASTRR